MHQAPPRELRDRLAFASLASSCDCRNYRSANYLFVIVLFISSYRDVFWFERFLKPL